MCLVEGQEVNLELGSAVPRGDFGQWLCAEGMWCSCSCASADRVELLLSRSARRALACVEARNLCLKRVLFHGWVCHLYRNCGQRDHTHF